MKKFIERLDEGPIREWYMVHREPDELNRIANYVEERGYSLDPKSGLFLMSPFGEEDIKQLGYTIIQIIFPRPTDFHVHEKMGEGIEVLLGGGVYFEYKQDKTSLEVSKVKKPIGASDAFLINPGNPHAFSPLPGTFLEIRVSCTEIYDDSQETTITPFNQVTDWQLLWS